MIMFSVAGASVGLSTSGYGPTFLSFANAGWFMVVLNDGTGGWSASDTYWFMTLTALDVDFSTGVQVTGAHYVYVELNCYKDVKALGFVSDLGEETMLFRGLHTKVGRVEKRFYKDVNRVNKVLKAFRYVKQKLRMLYETEEIRKLLHELSYTEDEVWMYDGDFDDGYREVTVISDEVPIEDRNELIESEIDIEYYE
jgi:hypothetical protein